MAQSLAQRVLDVIGQKAVDRIGLVTRELGKATDAAVASRQAQDALDHAQQARIKAVTVRHRALAIAADNAAPGRGEKDGRAAVQRRPAGDAGKQFGQVSALAQQIELKDQKGLFPSGRRQKPERRFETVE